MSRKRRVLPEFLQDEEGVRRQTDHAKRRRLMKTKTDAGANGDADGASKRQKANESSSSSSSSSAAAKSAKRRELPPVPRFNSQVTNGASSASKKDDADAPSKAKANGAPKSDDVSTKSKVSDTKTAKAPKEEKKKVAPAKKEKKKVADGDGAGDAAMMADDGYGSSESDIESAHDTDSDYEENSEPDDQFSDADDDGDDDSEIDDDEYESDASSVDENIRRVRDRRKRGKSSRGKKRRGGYDTDDDVADLLDDRAESENDEPDSDDEVELIDPEELDEEALQDECANFGLATKGRKATLLKRLMKALEEEDNADNVRGVWQWKADHGWDPYAPKTQTQVEDAFHQGKQTVKLTHDFFAKTAHHYIVNFENDMQSNLTTNCHRRVQRVLRIARKQEKPHKAKKSKKSQVEDPDDEGGGAFEDSDEATLKRKKKKKPKSAAEKKTEKKKKKSVKVKTKKSEEVEKETDASDSDEPENGGNPEKKHKNPRVDPRKQKKEAKKGPNDAKSSASGTSVRTVRLENKSNAAKQKFYQFVMDGAKLTTSAGKIGSSGRSQTVEMKSAAAVKKTFMKTLREKVAKGYVLASDSQDQDSKQDGDGDVIMSDSD